MRIAYGATKIGSNCPEVLDPCACGEEELRQHIRFQVHARPLCVTFFGLCPDDCLNINRLLGCKCMFEKPVFDDCGDLLCITEDCCEVMLIKPGTYDVIMSDRGEIPEEIEYETMAIGIEWAKLICDCGDVCHA